MNDGARDKIMNSWAGVSEVALIKEVATKGEHIQLCIEYWARKRQMSVAAYELFFQGVVETYVQRLLGERLVFKAENVLRNVKRDVHCFYYQHANDCGDAELRELLLDYLEKKDPANFAQDQEELQFYWEQLQQLNACPELLAKCQKQLRCVNLETLMTCDASFRQRLHVELYFARRNANLLPRLDKLATFHYLVDTQQNRELVRWCCAHSDDDDGDELQAKYAQWPLEPSMYDYALRRLKQADDVLRNCFAQAGYFFADERDNVAALLRRICTTQSFECNRELLENLPIGKFMLQHGLYMPLLCRFVSARELEELVDKCPEKGALLKLIVAMKENQLDERAGFDEIAHSARTYLEGRDVDWSGEQPLVTFHEFLANEPTVSALNCFKLSGALKLLPYLDTLRQRLQDGDAPTPYELLRKYRNVDFKDLSRDARELASFSNERMCQRYARQYHMNFLHYLKQQRSSYAVYYHITDQLQHYSQLTRAQLFSASEAATELALQHASNRDLVTHCVAFVEMLGFDTQLLRSFLKLARCLGDDSGVPDYALLIARVEAVLLCRLTEQPDIFPLAEYEALMRIAVACKQSAWPELIVRRYASEDDWWRLLVLLQYFDVPLPQMRRQLAAAPFKNRAMGDHIIRALSYEISASEKRKTKSSKSNAMNSSVETMTSSLSSSCDSSAYLRTFNSNHRFLPDTCGPVDLFSIVLLSSSATLPEEPIPNAMKFLELMQDNHMYCTSWNLMRNAVKFRLPVLAVLAGTVSEHNVDWNWLVWLAVATDQWQPELVRMIGQNAATAAWHLIEQAVRDGHTSTLYRSFSIFYEDNPLVHLLRFLQQTQQTRDFGDDVVHELRLFLLAWSNGDVQVPLQPTSGAAASAETLMLRSIKLLLVHLQNFHNTIEQERFLHCICRSDMTDICGVLDFCVLNRVFAILQARVPNWAQRFVINFEELLRRDNKEYGNLLASLRAACEYDAAISLAALLQLPICDIVYSKWVANMEGGAGDEVVAVYEREIAEHALPPEILVNFFLYAAGRLDENSDGEERRRRKYALLMGALNVIKRNHLFPNETFDRDQIEYDMIVCYLQLEDATSLAVYHSEYYEEIMVKERCVLYKSFLELKELAGIEDLTASVKVTLNERMQQGLCALLNRLLDEGDFVEALRLQELFEYRPLALRFLVFCMALAEGITTIFSLSPEERQMLRDVELSSFVRFNKRTLGGGTLRHSGGSREHGGSSPSTARGLNELSDSASTLEFEEIPSKEKRETLDTIKGIASKLRHGVDIGKRIVQIYRAAMYSDKEYLDLLRTKDVAQLLRSVAEEGCLHRLLVASDIFTATRMTAEEISELLAYEISVAVVRPRFYIFNTDRQTKNTFQNAELWGHNIDRDLHLFLELTPKTTLLGNRLLDYCDALKAYRKFQDRKEYHHTATFERLAAIITRYGQPPPASPSGTAMANSASAASSSPDAAATMAAASAAGPPQVLSHKKQNLIYVELLIKANQCFAHECCMEGIANVLTRAKSLNAILTQAKSWSLIVRMLIGIGRWREMFYCFATLIEHDQFESLLGQFDEEKTMGLRQAIIAYLREYHPEDGREFLKLAALHFLMYQDLAEMWEEDAGEVLAMTRQLAQIDPAQLPGLEVMNSLATTAMTSKVLIPKLRSSPAVVSLLQQALENYTHATENYLLDNKLLLAQKSASMAEMVAMQLDLVTCMLEPPQPPPPQLCVCVINVQSREEFRELVNSELRVPQAMILSRAYGYDINWAEALLSQFVILRNKSYLPEYLQHQTINDTIINNVVKGFQLYSQHHRPTRETEEHLAQLVELVQSITLKYKLASLLAIKHTVMSLINDQTVHYLRDTNYGRNEVIDI